VVPSLLQRPLTCRTTRKTVGPWGRPQGPLAPRTMMPPTSPTPSLVTSATTKRGRPVEIRYATGSKKFVRQPHHPTASPFHLPNRQRSRARVLGLDSWIEPLSSGGGRRVAPRKRKGAGTVQHRRKNKWRSKRGSWPGFNYCLLPFIFSLQSEFKFSLHLYKFV
jgi:hypothetical protein